MRDLKPQERELLDFLLGADFPGRDALRSQLAAAKVDELDKCPCLKFHVDEAVPAVVKHRIPIEASAKDADGVDIQVLLHVVDGRANELEFVKGDGSTIRQLPSLTNWRRFCPDNWTIE